MKVSGGHSTASGKVRTLPGTVQMISGAKGVYIADVEITDGAGQWFAKNNNMSGVTRATSSMFPDSWTRERIMVEVDGAYHSNPANLNLKPNQVFVGTSPSGICIRGVVGRTAFPDYPWP